jgi:threonine/homoserine/homoserine lactone efflux protein
MFDTWSFSLFLMAAIVIAATPGPGIFYVAARTLSGGRDEGVASSLGTAAGGLVRVGAGAFGVLCHHSGKRRTLDRAEACRRHISSLVGHQDHPRSSDHESRSGRIDRRKQGISPRHYGQGVKSKTAAFFLAFIPHFIEPDAGHVALQFAVFGLISVTLNTAADIAVVFLASAACRPISREPHFIRRLRQGSGLIISALGLSLSLSGRPGRGIDPWRNLARTSRLATRANWLLRHERLLKMKACQAPACRFRRHRIGHLRLNEPIAHLSIKGYGGHLDLRGA